MNNTLPKLVVFALFTLLCLACGCRKKAEAPAATLTTATGEKPMRSNDPRVLNDPNIPDTVKQQIRGGSGAGGAAPR